LHIAEGACREPNSHTAKQNTDNEKAAASENTAGYAGIINNRVDAPPEDAAAIADISRQPRRRRRHGQSAVSVYRRLDTPE